MNQMPPGYDAELTFAIWMWSAIGLACLCGALGCLWVVFA